MYLGVGAYNLDLKVSGNFSDVELLIEEDKNGSIGYHSTWVDTNPVSALFSLTEEILISVVIKLKSEGKLTINDISVNEAIIRADVNGDGDCNGVDVIVLARKLAGTYVSQELWIETPTTGDVNCDSLVNADDLELMTHKMAVFDMSTNRLVRRRRLIQKKFHPDVYISLLVKN